MIHPLPPGTRDVLPDEMHELRALTEAMRHTFHAAGYGEVWTPALEYEDVLRRGEGDGSRSPAAAGYRLFDEQGNVLALRSDMTIPIARLVASRYGEATDPLRLCYFAHAYRAGRPGQPREVLQGGLELIGVEAPEGDAEVVGITLDALEAAGLRRHRIGLSDGSLYGTLLDALGVARDRQGPLVGCLSRRDLVGLEMEVDRLGLDRAARRVLVTVPTLRGGPDVLSRADGPVTAAVENLRRCHELLRERGVADRVIFDLGMVRELGYYTGVVFEVYDPAVGYAIGGGGRYDALLGRFGAPRPACGVGLDIQRVHVAQAEEERLT